MCSAVALAFYSKSVINTRAKNESPLAGDFVLAYDKGDLLGDEVFFREK